MEIRGICKEVDDSQYDPSSIIQMRYSNDV